MTESKQKSATTFLVAEPPRNALTPFKQSTTPSLGLSADLVPCSSKTRVREVRRRHELQAAHEQAEKLTDTSSMANRAFTSSLVHTDRERCPSPSALGVLRVLRILQPPLRLSRLRRSSRMSSTACFDSCRCTTKRFNASAKSSAHEARRQGRTERPEPLGHRHSNQLSSSFPLSAYPLDLLRSLLFSLFRPSATMS